MTEKIRFVDYVIQQIHEENFKTKYRAKPHWFFGDGGIYSDYFKIDFKLKGFRVRAELRRRDIERAYSFYLIELTPDEEKRLVNMLPAINNVFDKQCAEEDRKLEEEKEARKWWP